MFTIAEQSLPSLIVPMVVLAVSACAAMWAWLAVRWWHGRPVLPYQPRRPVPWHAIDLAVIVFFYLFAQSGTFDLTCKILGVNPAALAAAAAAGHEKATAAHAVQQLMAHNNAWVLLLCFFSAVVVAPVSEEFFFRVTLQAWIEAREQQWRRKWTVWGARLPRGVVPIVPTAMLFALLHVRLSGPPTDARLLILGLVSNTLANVVTLLFAGAWLWRRAGATPVDFGWRRQTILRDVGMGLASFLIVALPIYALQCVVTYVLPPYVAPDPIPLFFFAVVLGVIYYRTHRVLPVIVLHAALNGTSLALALLQN